MSEFIFMLTQNDRTVPNALETVGRLSGTGLKHIGFKDVGATPEEQRAIAQAAKDAGMTVHLEVVSETREDELRSMDAAVAAGVDWVLGGKFAADSLAQLAGSGIKFAPFPGDIVGHPSELRGSIEEIVEHSKHLTAAEGIAGVDILAYRHRSVDPIELLTAAVQELEAPVIAAGSIATAEQIHKVSQVGVWAFTIGGAIFDGKLPGAQDLVSQVSTALEIASAV